MWVALLACEALGVFLAHQPSYSAALGEQMLDVMAVDVEHDRPA